MSSTVRIVVTIASAVLLVIGVGWWITSQSGVSTTAPERSVVTTTDRADSVAAEDVGTYADYSEAALAAVGEGDRVVLFFRASWCATCRAADAAITETQSEIPGDVHIFKVDFDIATDLRRQHGVTVQHTFVEVTPDGETVQRWVGSRDLDTVLAQL